MSYEQDFCSWAWCDEGRVWPGCRQPFPYWIVEGLLVIRQLTSGIAQSRSTRLAVTYLDRDTDALDKTSWQRSSSVQIKPLQSIVLSCERVPGTLQPSEFLGEFVQADGWARLPVTPLNPGSGKLRRTFLMSRSPYGVPGSSSGSGPRNQ